MSSTFLPDNLAFLFRNSAFVSSAVVYKLSTSQKSSSDCTGLAILRPKARGMTIGLSLFGDQYYYLFYKQLVENNLLCI